MRISGKYDKILMRWEAVKLHYIPKLTLFLAWMIRNNPSEEHDIEPFKAYIATVDFKASSPVN